MTDVSSQWAFRTLGEVCTGVPKAEPSSTGRSRIRYVDIGSVDGQKQVLADVQEIDTASAPSRARQPLKSGDTVFSTVRPYLKKIAYIDDSLEGEFASTGFCVLRPGEHLDPRWLFHFASSPGLLDQVLPLQRGVSYPAVRDRDVLSAVIPVPPLDEQRRIVAILEDHLGRLDAAERSITRAESLTQSITKSILLTAIPDEWPGHWQRVTVKEAGDSRLGRQRHPDWHTGPNMKGYLRVANVFEDRIDTSDVMQMDFTGCFDEFRLWPGDVLLNEGQSPHLLGRPAIYRGDPPDVAFTNSLIRFRPRDGITSEWSLLVFRRHMHARRFMRESRITTNIAHLSLKRLLAVEFPVPPLEEQQEIVARIHGQLDSVARLTGEVERQSARAAGLRKSLLSAAFSGQLTKESISV